MEINRALKECLVNNLLNNKIDFSDIPIYQKDLNKLENLRLF